MMNVNKFLGLHIGHIPFTSSTYFFISLWTIPKYVFMHEFLTPITLNHNLIISVFAYSSTCCNQYFIYIALSVWTPRAFLTGARWPPPLCAASMVGEVTGCQGRVCRRVEVSSWASRAHATRLPSWPTAVDCLEIFSFIAKKIFDWLFWRLATWPNQVLTVMTFFVAEPKSEA